MSHSFQQNNTKRLVISRQTKNRGFPVKLLNFIYVNSADYFTISNSYLRGTSDYRYTARDTAGKGYGNLAANNGPTSEKPFTNTISNQSCNYSKESVFRQFRTSPASHSWEALNNHMWPEKPIQAG